jgi:tripartite-type tricarboxylate transporter receptor subunit TctC
VQSTGLPNYETVLMLGVYLPAGTPAATVNFLNQEIVRVLTRSDLKEKLFNAGADVVASSPSALLTAVKADMLKWAKVIKEAGIRAE